MFLKKSGFSEFIIFHKHVLKPDLQHHIFFCNLCGINNLIQHMCIDQKILSELLLKIKFIFL